MGAMDELFECDGSYPGARERDRRIRALLFFHRASGADQGCISLGPWRFCLLRWLPSCLTRMLRSALRTLLGEIAVGLVYGLALSLLNEMLLFAGQIAGVQFSFSDGQPARSRPRNIQTPLMGDLFQLMGTLVLIAAGSIASCWLRWCAAFVPFR